ncbi:hypothetical protein K435DRAFT_844022 [Dendrothele bispora CBS 962.96]|uniref:Uncharacterized protein n=1 Tax=Dendrothele bispora (strain CBS 962.96) TaxID=1314807 RepID=A0A4S8L4J4_DENBC|nr:hypothetical protein K435DRAFT_844022 [Dendrothele bispora CBS 962.96]
MLLCHISLTDYPTKPNKLASESQSETKAKETNFLLDNDKEETVPAAVDSGTTTVHYVNQTLLSSLQDLTTNRTNAKVDEVKRTLVKMEADGQLPDLATSPKLDDPDRKGKGNYTSPERSGRERFGTSGVAPSDPVKASPSKNNKTRIGSTPLGPSRSRTSMMDIDQVRGMVAAADDTTEEERFKEAPGGKADMAEFMTRLVLKQ